MSQDQLLPELQRQIILNRAIAHLHCTNAERAQFYESFQSQTAYQIWLQQQGITAEAFELWLDHELRIRKFQYQKWGRKLYSYFLKRKRDLDQVICSLIYVREMALAQELYFRIVEGEQSFAAIARQYSQGQEAPSGGLVGPIALGDLHPQLANRLYGGQEGQLWFPTPFNEWVMIVRLEQWLPARLDATMRQQLLNELLETWLKEQMSTSI